MRCCLKMLPFQIKKKLLTQAKKLANFPFSSGWWLWMVMGTCVLWSEWWSSCGNLLFLAQNCSNLFKILFFFASSTNASPSGGMFSNSCKIELPSSATQSLWWFHQWTLLFLKPLEQLQHVNATMSASRLSFLKRVTSSAWKLQMNGLKTFVRLLTVCDFTFGLLFIL